MAIVFDELQIKEIEKKLKKLPKKAKRYNATEAVEIIEKTILLLHKNKGYMAKEIVAELEKLGLKTSLRKVNSIFKQLEKESENEK